MSAVSVDFVRVALATPRDEFASACPFPFLAGATAFIDPDKYKSIEMIERIDLVPTRLFQKDGRPPSAKIERPRATALAIRKVQDAFHGMITVGRTTNNDIVLPDAQISRFHAFFRVREAEIELRDNSRNGTWIGDRQLPSKGRGEIVRHGDLIRFGHLEFTLLDAAGCWEWLHRFFERR